MTLSNEHPKRALVLSGGGARGAYEAGIIHYICTKILPLFPKQRRRGFDILSGSSVGAINTCFLAATSHNLEYQGEMAYKIWHDLKQESIYRRDVGALTRLMMRSFTGILRNIFGGSRQRDVRRFMKVHFKLYQVLTLDQLALPASNLAGGRGKFGSPKGIFEKNRLELQVGGQNPPFFLRFSLGPPRQTPHSKRAKRSV